MNPIFLMFFAITSIGSSLTTVFAFLRIEPQFKNIVGLGLALSFRTLGKAIFSYNINHIFDRFGIKRSLIVSQVFGALALSLIYYGFRNENFLSLLAGLVLTGLPSNLLTVGIRTYLKSQNLEEREFRANSAMLDKIAGFSLVFASISVPFLLKFGMNDWILELDFLSYIVAALLIYIKFAVNPVCLIERRPKVNTNYTYLISGNFKRFALLVSASLLFVGFVPLLAGSSTLSEGYDISDQLRQYLWLFEGLSVLFSAYLYINLKGKKAENTVYRLTQLSSLLIIGMQFLPMISAKLLLCLMVALSFNLAFIRARDDLILSTTSIQQAETAASLTEAFKAVACTLTPPLLALIFAHFSLFSGALILLGIQVTFYVTRSLILQKIPEPSR